MGLKQSISDYLLVAKKLVFGLLELGKPFLGGILDAIQEEAAKHPFGKVVLNGLRTAVDAHKRAKDLDDEQRELNKERASCPPGWDEGQMRQQELDRRRADLAEHSRVLRDIENKQFVVEHQEDLVEVGPSTIEWSGDVGVIIPAKLCTCAYPMVIRQRVAIADGVESYNLFWSCPRCNKWAKFEPAMADAKRARQHNPDFDDVSVHALKAVVSG